MRYVQFKQVALSEENHFILKRGAVKEFNEAPQRTKILCAVREADVFSF